MLEGGCHCGDFRYRITTDPIFVNGCHCRDCQTLTGSAFAINAMIERTSFETMDGRGAATDPDGNIWCRHCRTFIAGTLPEAFGRGILFLRVGTLDESERLSPDAHFFVRSKHPWVVLPSGVPTYETMPGEGQTLFSPEQQARVTAARMA
jgi:hypothetical protein